MTRRPALLVDAHGLGDSGLGRYTRELVRHLAARDEFRMIYCAGDPRVLASWLTDASAASPAGLGSTTTPVSMIPFRHARHSPRVPFAWAAVEAQVEGPRVSWFPHWDGSWRAQSAVTTIHDLIYLSEPGLAGAAKGAVARAWIGRMVGASRALVTVSEHSAAQIVAAFPAAAGKLHVVPNGVSAVFFGAVSAGAAVPSAAMASAVVPHGASSARPYLLTVGNKRPHKRFETAIRAFALLAAERPELELRMVGNRDASTATLRELATSLGVAERVHDLAALDDASLAALYAGAEALLVTSREEGFGLIAAEAMAAGCPVIAVDRGPLREVVGEAGILVPYDDAAAIAAALRGLQAAPLRAARIAAGHAQAARFTWAGAAAALAPVLAAAARD